MSEKKLEPCEVCGMKDELVNVEIHGTKIYKARLCTNCVNKVINDVAEARKLALKKFDEELLGKMIDDSNRIIDLMNRRWNQ